LQDFYAILGLDPSASQESLKVAYRRLARKYHPDLKVNCSVEEQASVQSRMADLNEAYATLSNSKSRREYDERLRLESLLTSSKSGGKSVHNSVTATAEVRHSRVSAPAVRPRHEVDTSVVHQFSGHLRERLITQKSAFTWQTARFEGFDWGLESSDWFSHYCIAVRSFASLDSATARKFVNYSERVLQHAKRRMKRNFFVFLLPFRQIDEWESVSNQINALLNRKNRAGASVGNTAVILLDMHHSRIVRLGARFSDQQFEHLLQSIRTAG
jgi:curved DNA-binding protein CbpA